jgi:hypothetical protein
MFTYRFSAAQIRLVEVLPGGTKVSPPASLVTISLTAQSSELQENQAESWRQLPGRQELGGEGRTASGRAGWGWGWGGGLWHSLTAACDWRRPVLPGGIELRQDGGAGNAE